MRTLRAIREIHLSDLTDFILIAGPNGCGKSCILDAVRLLKSAYGGYQHDEVQAWFGEFQINMQDHREMFRLFREPSRQLLIEAEVALSDAELLYIRSNAAKLIEPEVWRSFTGQYVPLGMVPISGPLLQHVAQVRAEAAQRAEQLLASLNESYGTLRFSIDPSGLPTVAPNLVMQTVFATYDPDNLGIIDYHSSSRNYQREALGGVDLNIRNVYEQRKSQAPYNSQAKYQHIKSELAATYVRDVLAREAGVETSETNLNDSLKELFQTFFPDKEYAGVIPESDGSLSFPVRTGGGEHDLNELSSGEKELVYGYLRLRNTAPRNSTVLIDEPELHLNPGLLREMPSFYHRHIGRERGNQLWLVTHSDALLSSAVGNTNYSVFHMMPAITGSGNQVNEVLADDELQTATIALVGDLAAYQPRSKVVILEGGGDVEFDLIATSRLFPEFAKRVNLVPGGSKRRVRDLHTVLARIAPKIGITNRFFSVVDRDSETDSQKTPGARRFSWDRYHIENYLLTERYIRLAANEVAGRKIFADDDAVTAALVSAAGHIKGAAIIEMIRQEINSQLTRAIDFGVDPQATSASDALRPSLQGTLRRVREQSEQYVESNALTTLEATFEAELSRAVDDGSWRSKLPGRQILKRLVAQHLEGAASYNAFRLLIVGRMAQENHQPEGMKTVLDSIAAADLSVNSDTVDSDTVDSDQT